MRIALIHSMQPGNLYAGQGTNEMTQMRRVADQLHQRWRARGVDVELGPGTDYNRDGRFDFADNVRWVNDRNRVKPFNLLLSFHSNAAGDSMLLWGRSAASARYGDTIRAALNADNPFPGDQWTYYDRKVSELTQTNVPAAVLLELSRHDRTREAAHLVSVIRDGTLAAHLDRVLTRALGLPTTTQQEDDMTPELAARLDQIVEFFNNRLNQNRDELAAWARDQIAAPLSAEVAAGVAHLGQHLTAQLHEFEDRAVTTTVVPAVVVATIDAIKGGTSAESIAEAVGSIVAEQTSTAVAQLAANLDAAVTQLVQALHDALDGRDNDAAVAALREVLENTSFTLAPRTEADQ